MAGEQQIFECANCGRKIKSDRIEKAFGFVHIDVLCTDCHITLSKESWDQLCKELEENHENEDYDDRVMEG